MPDADGFLDMAVEALVELAVGAMGLVADQGVDAMREKRRLQTDSNRRTVRELQVLSVAMWKILQRDHGYDVQKLKERVAQMCDDPQKFSRLANKYIRRVKLKEQEGQGDDGIYRSERIR